MLIKITMLRRLVTLLKASCTLLGSLATITSTSTCPLTTAQYAIPAPFEYGHTKLYQFH